MALAKESQYQGVGLQTGDIITQLGENMVNGMMGYMKTLSMFKSADTTTMVIVRDKQAVSAESHFSNILV